MRAGMIGHSMSRRRRETCELCPGLDGKPGPCDQYRYSPAYMAFLRAHLEAYTAAYLDGNQQAAANELERLDRERRSLPRGHVCSCYPTHCLECARLARQRVSGPDVAVAIGRTALVNAPTPRVDLLDMAAGYV